MNALSIGYSWTPFELPTLALSIRDFFIGLDAVIRGVYT